MLGSFRRRGCTCKKKRCTCGSKWHYRYDVIDPKTGKRKQKETRGFATKPEAEAEAKRILAELERGTFVEEKDISFEVFSKQWLELYKASGKVKKSTIDIRETRLKRLLEYFGNIKVKDITKLMYQNMLNDLSRRGLSRKTIASAHETGSLIFKKAVDLGVVATDITHKIDLPRERKTVEELEQEEELPKYLEKEALAVFLKTIKDHGLPVDYPLFLMLAYTGMRVGELCALKWRDINFDEQTISITKTLYNPNMARTGYILQTPKTKSSRRTIDVDQEVLDALEHYRKWQEFIKSDRKNYHDEGFIFTRETLKNAGYPLVTNFIIKKMTKFLKLARLNESMTPHSLRHTHTSLLAEAGVSLETIMNRLGHESDVITKKVYLHVTKPRKKEASQKFAELMRGL